MLLASPTQLCQPVRSAAPGLVAVFDREVPSFPSCHSTDVPVSATRPLYRQAGDSEPSVRRRGEGPQTVEVLTAEATRSSFEKRRGISRPQSAGPAGSNARRLMYPSYQPARFFPMGPRARPGCADPPHAGCCGSWTSGPEIENRLAWRLMSSPGSGLHSSGTLTALDTRQSSLVASLRSFLGGWIEVDRCGGLISLLEAWPALSLFDLVTPP